MSILALNGVERGGDRPIKEPEHSISEVLKHALDLIHLGEARNKGLALDVQLSKSGIHRNLPISYSSLNKAH